MKFLKLILIFFSDLSKTKKNIFFKNSDKSYMVMRFLYFISDGLILYFISIFLKLDTNLSSKFKLGYLKYDQCSEKEANNIREEILKMRLLNKEVKNDFIKINNNHQIDFEYYSSKSLMRLDINPQDLLSSIRISRFILNKCWIDEVKKILGCKPYVVGVGAWITLPPPTTIHSYDEIGKFVSSQMWHRDCDNLRDIKVMTYFTDVKEKNDGPFEFIESSHCFNFFNPFRYSMGSSGMRVNNNYIQKKFDKKIRSFYGNSGSSFIFDTRGLHRGKTISKKNHYRVMLEIYFSNHPFGKIKKLDRLSKNLPSYELWEECLKKDTTYQFLFNS